MFVVTTILVVLATLGGKRKLEKESFYNKKWVVVIFLKLKKYDTYVVITIFATLVARKHKTYNNNISNFAKIKYKIQQTIIRWKVVATHYHQVYSLMKNKMQ
jgi:hypothetical protein